MSLELNKFLGALFGCLLVVVLIHLTGQYIFTTAKPLIPGYDLPVAAGQAESAAPAAAAAADVPLPVLLAQADPERGKVAAKKCAACHTFDKGGKNAVGPNLWGIVDRMPASHEGFAYSAAMKERTSAWTFEDIDHMITSPQKFLKGTKMAFVGVPSAKERADILAYLRTLSDSPVDFPKAP